MVTVPLTLAQDEVHVWVSDLERAARRNRPLDLTPGEHTKVEAADSDIRKRELAHTRSQLRWILSQYMGQEPSDFTTDRFGRLGLDSNTYFDFNLSHSGRWAAYVFSKSSRVGVDIEVLRHHDLDRFKSRLFSEKEQQRFRFADESSKKLHFYSAWTAKEAASKIFGEGLGLPFPEIELEDKRIVGLPQDKDVAYATWHSEDFCLSVAYTQGVRGKPIFMGGLL